MARPPKPDRENNPLRVLRHLLGSKEAPITQERLAKICAIPTPTIRAIEAGQRNLTPTVLRDIQLMTGACWDDKGKRWITESLTADQRGLRFRRVPCTPELIWDYIKTLESSGASLPEACGQETRNDSSDLRTRMHGRHRVFLNRRVDALLDAVVGRARLQLVVRLVSSLEEVKNQLKNQGLLNNLRMVDQVFRATSPSVLMFYEAADGFLREAADKIELLESAPFESSDWKAHRP